MGGIGEVVSTVAGAASLFGGGDDGGGISAQNVPVMTPEQQALLKRMSELVLEEIERKPQPFPGQLTAGPSEIQQGVFDRVLSSLGEGLPSPLQQRLFGDVGERFGDFVRSPMEAAMQAGDVFEQTVAAPTRTSFLRDFAPQLQEQFVGANALSSSGFQRQLARQAANLEEGLSGQRAAFIDAADRRRLQDILGISQIAQQEGQIPAQQLNQLIQAGLLGAEQRGIEQQRLSGELSEFLRLNQIPTPALAPVMGQPLQASAFQPVVQQAQPSPFASSLSNLGMILGGGYGGYGGYGGGGGSSIFSSIF